jgi:hypothetical protein
VKKADQKDRCIVNGWDKRQTGGEKQNRKLIERVNNTNKVLYVTIYFASIIAARAVFSFLAVLRAENLI